MKKKRDEHLKMVWRVSPSHKRLQARMEHMRRFRRHHEQLRTVMLRVHTRTHTRTHTHTHIHYTHTHPYTHTRGLCQKRLFTETVDGVLKANGDNDKTYIEHVLMTQCLLVSTLCRLSLDWSTEWLLAQILNTRRQSVDRLTHRIGISSVHKYIK